MKHIKKLIVAALAVMTAVALCVPAVAFAVDHQITIHNTNTTISINGKTYSAYKLFDSTHSGTNYAYTMSTSSQFYSADLLTPSSATGMAKVLTDYFTFTAVPGSTTFVNVTPKVVSDGKMTEATAREFADKIQQYLNGKTATATSPAATNETATITLPADDAGQGYYIVTGNAVPTDPNSSATEVVSAVILTNEDPSAAIQPKASVPTLDKKITGEFVLDEAGQAAAAEVGKVINYELTSQVPDLRGYSTYTFTFNDTITAGLTYNQSSFALKIGNDTVSIDPVFPAGDDPKSFSLTIPMNTLKNYNVGTKIVLTYSATVNSNSLDYDYEMNTATIDYSNNPYDSTSHTPTPPKITYVINVNVDVVKHNNQNEKLDGAKFKLYKGATLPDDDAAAWYKWDNNKVTWVTKANADEFVTGTDGKLTQQVRGLEASKNGTNYGLVETKAPKGYNTMTAPIPFKLTSAISTVQGGKKVTVTSTSGTVTPESVTLTATQPSGHFLVTHDVLNQAGTVLPSTGGIGTTIFYIIGAILVIGAGVVLITKRRVAKKNEIDEL